MRSRVPFQVTTQVAPAHVRYAGATVNIAGCVRQASQCRRSCRHRAVTPTVLVGTDSLLHVRRDCDRLSSADMRRSIPLASRRSPESLTEDGSGGETGAAAPRKADNDPSANPTTIGIDDDCIDGRRSEDDRKGGRERRTAPSASSTHHNNGRYSQEGSLTTSNTLSGRAWRGVDVPPCKAHEPTATSIVSARLEDPPARIGAAELERLGCAIFCHKPADGTASVHFEQRSKAILVDQLRMTTNAEVARPVLLTS